ncbi:MAG: P-loop NTPase [Peptococcaceae bacterium]|nr:P-loop NTPase [Peptococcaceae bacterium]
MDPRLSVIDKRLENIGRIIAVSGGKGGIGKSVTASTLALLLAKQGLAVGLLDMDLCGPSDHVILGIPTGAYPEEDKGLIPPEAHGVRFMSITYFAGQNPVPLRGQEVSNAIIEMLAITRWPDLDCLIIDMPPGTGDPALDVIRFIKPVEFLVVTTQSRVALAMAEKELSVLQELKVKVAGVLENLRLNDQGLSADKELSRFPVTFFGPITYDPSLEAALGDGEKLLQTGFAAQLAEVAKKLGK